ncbi:DUF4232 domain-containing protein [Amycolatopsis saalfeldensis]|uniref:DUF4232 domain-containing protein n=1 Tax=Amycolatopsis saalfeldensis TaxID=394193 RepID=A0A1H8YG06_9PSEU|nr:DUF4232 domain-containing protein [Amycolatopsis saalfeldensis]SEP51089.1 Protein of unknown function [Amycolatopsis saalfeldensis]
MGNLTKRVAATVATGAVVAGGLLLASGAASANPSDTPCGTADVQVGVTADPAHAAGHEAYVLTYTAAAPTTNCKLEGTPSALAFAAGAQPIPDVAVTPDGATGGPVNLRAGHPAESRIVQQVDAPANALTPTAVSFQLPSGQPVSAAWPAGAPLKGAGVQVTAIS